MQYKSMASDRANANVCVSGDNSIYTSYFGALFPMAYCDSWNTTE